MRDRQGAVRLLTWTHRTDSRWGDFWQPQGDCRLSLGI